MSQYWEYASTKARNAGVELHTLTAPQMARQALVLWVDGGKEATELMDQMQEGDRQQIEQDEQDAAGIPDNLIVPEGMGLMESSLGVVP